MIFVSYYHSYYDAFFDVRFSVLFSVPFSCQLILLSYQQPWLDCAGHRPAICVLFFYFQLLAPILYSNFPVPSLYYISLNSDLSMVSIGVSISLIKQDCGYLCLG